MPRELPDITADWLLARVVEQDGCLVWRLECCNGGKDPRATINGERVNVRRAVWKALTGRAPREDWSVGVSCETPGCTDPAHLVHRSRSAALTGRTMPMLQRIRIAESKRATSELPQERVAGILGSSLSASAEAELHGISKSMVTLIRAGRMRRDYSSPFAQLGAR